MAVQSLEGKTPIKQVQLTLFKGEFVLIFKLKYTTELSRKKIVELTVALTVLQDTNLYYQSTADSFRH